ncbi:MAG: RDD family protein [Candidatus Margulisiibacteriota bacterium]
METNNNQNNNRDVFEKYEAQYGSKPKVTVDADDLKDLLEHQEFKMQGVTYVNPEDEREAEAQNIEGVSLLEGGHLKEAIQKLKKSVKLNPENPYYLINLARCYVAAHFYELAIDTCKRALDLEPYNEWVKKYLKYAIFLYENRDNKVLQQDMSMAQDNCVTERVLASLIDTVLFAVALIVLLVSKTAFPAAIGLLFASALIYWLFMEYFFQASIGKMVLKLKIVRLDEEKLAFGDVVKRLLTRFLGDVYLLAFLSCLYTHRHQRAGDLWARTLVVRTTREKVPYHFDYQV